MSFDTGLSPTTELDAVNQMLVVVGESPVSTLDENTLIESGMALRLLRSESRALQMRGWNFNTDESATFLPDTVTGEVRLPLNTLSVTFHGNDTGGALTYRAGKVYDRRKQSFALARSILADVVILLPFEDMPEPARNYVMIRSCRRFQDSQLGDGALHQFEESDEMSAWAEFLGREAEDSDYNINRDSPSVRIVTSRRGARI
jgi:hypothetical protein